MHSRRFLLSITLPIAALLASAMPGSATIIKDSSETRVIGPGVTHTHETFSTGPLNCHVVRVQLRNRHSQVEAEPGQNKMYAGEDVPTLSGRESKEGRPVLAAVNGDFWSSAKRLYVPIGLLVSDGMIHNLPSEKSVLALEEDDRPFLGILSMKVEVAAKGQKLRVDKINSSQPGDIIVLYTPPFGARVEESTSSRNILLELPGPEFLPNLPTKARVLEITQGPVQLQPNRVVLSLPLDREFAVAPGHEVRLSANVPEIPAKVVSCVGGGPRIVRNGRVSVEYEREGMGKSFSMERHPRTAVGLSKDKKILYLVTVDGRQPSFSVGMSLYELGAYMISLGCSDAMNLDGGGSTTMVINGELANKPSDLRGPRSVANALLVTATQPPGELSRLVIEPDFSTAPVPAGASVVMRAQGFDKIDNPVTYEGPMDWSCDPELGQIKIENGSVRLVTAPKLATGTVQVKARAIAGKTDVKTAVPDAVSVSPSSLLLTPGETASLEVTAQAGGKPMLVTPEMTIITVPAGNLQVSGLSVKAGADARGTLEAKLGEVKTVVPYYINQFKTVTLDPLDTWTTGVVGRNYDEAATKVSPETTEKKGGAASLGVQYAMTHGGRSRIILPLEATIEKEAPKLALWIYGDGQEAWLRGDLVDSLGFKFTVDFTEGSKGIYWNKEWRRGIANAESIMPSPENPGKRPQYPAKLVNLYVAQDQEALKRSGRILLDQLEALYPPE